MWQTKNEYMHVEKWVCILTNGNYLVKILTGDKKQTCARHQ